MKLFGDWPIGTRALFSQALESFANNIATHSDTGAGNTIIHGVSVCLHMNSMPLKTGDITT